MTRNEPLSIAITAKNPHPARRSAFTLIELLTVIFIIGLLVGILIPTLNMARIAAKSANTQSLLRTIDSALEMFRQENERDFSATRGYPPSFAHPKIRGHSFNPYQGQYPFHLSQGSNPRIYGAHWLAIMLLGPDAQGYVKASTVPPALRSQPYKWYSPDPRGDNSGILDRASLYLDPDKIPLMKTSDLVAGFENSGDRNKLFPDWGSSPADGMRELPVIVDPFDQPILYYAASAFGGKRNMLTTRRLESNDYGELGQPVYFHQDNEGFTGNQNTHGWDFTGEGLIEVPGSSNEEVMHWIEKPGDLVTANQIEGIDDEQYLATFANYIYDRNALAQAPRNTPENPPNANYPLRPVRTDTFLLITAGPDGRYGTEDDVSNIPKPR